MEKVYLEQDLLDTAEAAHEVNAAYCRSIGDNSQPSWKDAPEWQKKSALEGVINLLDNPNATPEDSHKNWLAQKEMDGWKYGEKKDVEAKTHPCMVPYDKLPKEQRIKDHLFLQVVRSVLPMLDGRD